MELKTRTYNKRNAGFSLLEIILVLAITSFTLTASIYVVRLQAEHYKFIITQTKLDSINMVLQAYNEKHGSYPCPAAPNAPEGADGIAAVSCTICTGVYGPSPYYCVPNSNVIIGVIPFKTLGLARQMSFDSWDRKITYAIDNRYTADQCQGKGSIQIIDKNGSQVSNVAIYTLISTGSDMKGGYDTDGNIIKACDTSAIDGQNCAFTLGQINFSNIFRTETINIGNIASTYYDDIIKWQTNTNLTYCPAQIGNCILWMDGADICTITTNLSNQVISWLDKSPSNLNASVPLASNSPALTNTTPNLLNKETYLTFNSVNSNLLSITSVLGILPQTNFTKIIVFRTSSVAMAAITAAAQGSTFASIDDRQFGPLASGQMSFAMQGGSQINSSSSYTDGKAHVATITVDSITGERMFVDGIRVAIGTSTSSTLIADSLLIGGSSTWGYYNGDLMEVLVYNTALSDTERKTVETYLATKWGMPY